MTYEENVHKVAEEICSSVLVRDWNVTTGPERDTCYKSARIAVRLQSEAVRDALTIVFIQQCGYNDAFTKQLIDSHLIERGLIPAPEVKKKDQSGFINGYSSKLD